MSMFEARFVCTILGFDVDVDVAAEMAVLWAAAAGLEQPIAIDILMDLLL